MSLPILQPKDFTGLYKISQNSFNELALFIEAYEEKLLIKLLGVDLAAALIADLDVNNVPQSARFIDIWQPFNIEIDNILCLHSLFINSKPGYNGKLNIISNGIKEFLKANIYWQYTKQQKQKNTVSGQAVNQTEVSREANLLEAQIDVKYNLGIDTGHAIQRFILTNKTDYPEFNGQRLQKIFFSGAF